ncbi:sigma factor-like helix-turn-helix DNA-binding protein [Micromonospora sp. MH99]|uniref:sigma factor-like helix-turn-helix DNA-binding protein n=1 Tax=Micromonospora sp. MH99 TaxID=1945510 RepID=UPI001F32A9E1|nr:sigma factor-like helix-turn-helix DNA-binding protein [Micromonospora sp. MH99]MCF0093090.1 RNA polymerase sigma factor RpoH [Micromonospora sp. MH99]
MTSAPFGDLPPEAYHDALWNRVLPWLAHHTPATARELADLTPSPDWWLTESPAVTTMMVEHEALCRQLARFFLARHLDAAFGKSFPTVPARMPLATLTMAARARTAFQRLQAQTVADLEMLSVKDLYDVRGTGQGTVEEVIAALVSAAIIRSGDLPETDVSGEDDPSANAPVASLPPAQAQLLEDLAQLAAWHHLRRRSGQSLLKVVIEDGAPEQIQEVALRLNSLTAADLGTNSGSSDPVLEFTAVLSELDERQLRILRDRLLGRPPRTLAELAIDFDVTRERVRQIEIRLKELLARTFHFGTSIGNLLASLRAEIQPIAALDRLITLHPDLARDVPGVGVPLWLVLDRLDDYFEVSEGWAAAPDVSAAREQTRILLEDFATEHGLVDLAAAASATAMPKAELLSWLSWCGYIVYNDQILTRTRSLNDHAAGVLAATGEPLQTDELHREMGRDTTIRSLTNVLGSDDRFIRTDRATWGLASWELEEYTSIRQQIGIELAAAGGQIELSRLVESITNRFDVSPSSVQAYAGNGEFEIVDRVVRRRESPAAPRKAPSATRRLFRHGDVWKLRIVITRDHLRGSGFPVPSGVANLVGCVQGEVVELDSELGTQSIRWTGLQPASGTIKRFLDQLQAREGQSAFLEFRPYGRFGLTVHEPPAPSTDPLAQALSLIGATEISGAEVAKSALATAVDLPEDAKPRRILAAYRQRGDDDIAALLEQVWTGQRHYRAGERVTAESHAVSLADPDDGHQPQHHDLDADVNADDAPPDGGVPEEDSSAAWVPVPAGYRSVGWVRPHEAEAAVLAYQLHADVPVHSGDEITGWARYVDEASTNNFNSHANVKLVRTRAQGERIACWIREHEAFSVTQASAERRSITVTGPDGETAGLVEYYRPGSEEAERFLSSTRLLRGRPPG